MKAAEAQHFSQSLPLDNAASGPVLESPVVAYQIIGCQVSKLDMISKAAL